MGRQKNRQIAVIELTQQVPHLTSGNGVHTCRRFIQKKDLRFCQKSPTDHQFSFHAAGKLSNRPSAKIQSVRKFQQFFRLFPDLFLQKKNAVCLFHNLIHGHVLPHGIFLRDDADLSFQSGIFPAEHLSIDQDLPFRRQEQGRHQTNGRCLSCSVRSQSQKFSVFYLRMIPQL